MKTLFRTYGPEQAKSKAREYTEKFGVKFDFYSTGPGWRVVPVATRETTPIDDPTRADEIKRYLKNWTFGCGFATIANITGYPIADVVGISWHLIKTNAISFDVDRLGNIAGIRLAGSPAGKVSTI